MICRLWHGWTKPQNADAYERLLKEEVFAGIAGRKIDGYHGPGQGTGAAVALRRPFSPLRRA
jgi:hypothetical protein